MQDGSESDEDSDDAGETSDGEEDRGRRVAVNLSVAQHAGDHVVEDGTDSDGLAASEADEPLAMGDVGQAQPLAMGDIGQGQPLAMGDIGQAQPLAGDAMESSSSGIAIDGLQAYHDPGLDLLGGLLSPPLLVGDEIHSMHSIDELDFSQQPPHDGDPPKL